jgi:hypothetical protein
MTSKSSRGHLLSALAELTTLDRAALAQRWTAAFGVPAPKSCQATLLRQAPARHLPARREQADRDLGLTGTHERQA